MKKRLLSLILVVVMAIGLCLPAAAVSVETTAVTYRAIKIVINEKEITPCDEAGNTVEPFIMNSNGTTYLPLRAIAQALGLDVSWDGPTSTVTLKSGGAVKTGTGAPGTSKGSGNVNITYRDIKVILDGSQLNLVNRDGKKVEPFILNANSSVYLPLRVIGEALGLSVKWDGETSTASLSGTVGNKAVKELSLSATDVTGEVGGYFRLEAYITPDDAVNKTVTWSSTDSKVAYVTADGIVVLRAVGSADISATSINGKTAVCHVIVRSEKDDDSFSEDIGYSRDEIEKLVDYATESGKLISKALDACGKAEEAEHMASLHVNTAIGHAHEAAVEMAKAVDFLKGGASIPVDDEDYETAQNMASVALAQLNNTAKLKAESENADEVLAQVKIQLNSAGELIDSFVSALEGIEFDTAPETDKEEGGKEENKEVAPNSLVIDKNGIKVTVKDIVEEGTAGPSLGFVFENKAGKKLSFSCIDVIVNDFAVESYLDVPVEDGKKTEEQLVFSASTLEKHGIEKIKKAEFKFIVFDEEKYEDYLPSVTVSVIFEEETEEDKTSPMGSLILNEAGIKITAQEFVEDGSLGPELKLFIENSSGKDLEIQCCDASVNDFMVETTISAVVLNGKKANDKIIFDKASLEENGIKEISKIEFSFHIFEKGKFDTTYLDSKPIIITVGEETEPDTEESGSVSGIIGEIVDGGGDLSDILDSILGGGTK